mmetsp:Transcript_6284/g.9630  ORF Transcript_6284/g.9630 Transcript_6284/m.9630 type:complete len:203 (+) Transcript_6284:975-1583(+)
MEIPPSWHARGSRCCCHHLGRPDPHRCPLWDKTNERIVPKSAKWVCASFLSVFVSGPRKVHPPSPSPPHPLLSLSPPHNDYPNAYRDKLHVPSPPSGRPEHAIFCISDRSGATIGRDTHQGGGKGWKGGVEGRWSLGSGRGGNVGCGSGESRACTRSGPSIPPTLLPQVKYIFWPLPRHRGLLIRASGSRVLHDYNGCTFSV